MRVLPVGLIDQIQRFDPSVDLLFNRRLNRWIVVQKLPGMRVVSPHLRGCAAIPDNAKRTPYKFLFKCEFDEGFPALPGNWILKRLAESCPHAGREAERFYDAVDERQERARTSAIDEVVDDTVRDLKKFGGISRLYGGGDRGLERRSVDLGARKRA